MVSARASSWALAFRRDRRLAESTLAYQCVERGRSDSTWRPPSWFWAH